MTDETIITQKINEIAATADHYPGVVIVLNIRTRSVVYMSQRGLELLKTSPEELEALGPDYHNRFFNPDEAEEYVPKIFGLLEQNDLQHVVSFFQQVRTSHSPDWSLYFTTVRLLARGADGLPLLIISCAHPVDPASHVAGKVQRLIDENNFLRRHHHKFAQLTRRECEVLRGLALGKTAADIAAELAMSVQTAETHRRNIRQKLQPESGFELGQYARAFNLI
jgi:DNA-binding CsgD family transcriptional regulator